MIENLIYVIGYVIMLGIYGMLAFAGFMIVQLISYRVFGFNLYKWLMKNLLK